MDSKYVGVLMVSGKSPDNFTARSSSSFVDKLRAEKTRLRYDSEPAMRLLAEKIAVIHARPSWNQSTAQSTRVLEELKEHIRIFMLQHER